MAQAPNKKLKIGFVLDTSLDPNDGVQQYVLNLGTWLSAQGHEVHYLVGQTKHRRMPNLHSLARNFSVRFNGNRTTVPLPVNRSKLRRLLQKEKFDVLHVQVPYSPFMSQRLILAADLSTLIVGTFHIAAYSRLTSAGNRLLRLWLRRSLKRFDVMLSVSEAAQSFAKQTFKISSSVLPNVIDYQLYHSAKPLAKYDDQILTILFLGRLVPRKGALTLVKAIKLLAENPNLPIFRVVVCGSGPLEKKLHSFVKANHLSEIIELTGFVDEADKPHYYASADVAVFPSSGGESFGIVLLEAMASGRAVVLAGDNSGYRSVLSPKPDLLFTPNNPQLLADKLELYIKNSKLRSQMANWGEGYSREFDVGRVGKQLIDIYNQALHKQGSQ